MYYVGYVDVILIRLPARGALGTISHSILCIERSSSTLETSRHAGYALSGLPVESRDTVGTVPVRRERRNRSRDLIALSLVVLQITEIEHVRKVA
jgi:hypothetical protein